MSAAALLLPDRSPLLLGPVSDAPADASELVGLRYPDGRSVVTAGDIDIGGGGCAASSRTPAHATLTSVSLFGGAVSAANVQLVMGDRAEFLVSGLRVDGTPVASDAGRTVPLGGWGKLVVESGTSTAPVEGAVAALAVHLLRAHAGLPAGTTLLVSVAGVRHVAARAKPVRHRTRHHAKHKARRHAPLKVTPALDHTAFVFPVAGNDVSFVDTYGAFRGDVPGKWHHGDDIFAPLGTPVVAVASGTLNRVGWNSVGGWRLWVRDDGGDEFYYAHLSGYAPLDLHSTHVHAGDVIGFVGNTGDAFSTSPHLHFEIHPRRLLHLDYDGAVDPTGYLGQWPHPGHVAAPRPALPALPAPLPLEREARYVWRELLVARHLVRHLAATRPHVAASFDGSDAPQLTRQPSSATAVTAMATASPRGSIAAALLANAVAVALLVALAAALGYAARGSSPTSRSRG